MNSLYVGTRVLLAALFTVAGCGSAEAAAPLPGDSLYQLPIHLKTQDGHTTALAAYRGRALLVSMFYASCPAVCPTLIEQLKQLQRGLPEGRRDSLRVLLVSFDPQRDTPERLAALAALHRVALPQWTLASVSRDDGADADATRTLAAALGVQYRALPDGRYDHSTTVVLLDPEGRIVARSASLGSLQDDLQAALRRLPAAP